MWCNSIEGATAPVYCGDGNKGVGITFLWPTVTYLYTPSFVFVWDSILKVSLQTFYDTLKEVFLWQILSVCDCNMKSHNSLQSDFLM